MSATAGGRRRDDVRLVLHVGMDVCFIPLRNAYAERCVWRTVEVRWKGASFVWRGKRRRSTAEEQGAQRKARTLTQRTRRKAEKKRRWQRHLPQRGRVRSENRK